MNILKTIWNMLKCHLPEIKASKFGSWSDNLKSLAFDGGPSVTRWVFIRTAEVISLGWLGMVGGACYRYIVFGTSDVVFCGMILTIGGGLFAFAQQAQVAKLSLDSKGAAVESSPLSTTVTHEEEHHDNRT